MKPKRRKPGVREVTGPKVALGERSLDRATHRPHPAHALGEVLAAPNGARMARRSRRRTLSEERAGLVEGAGAALAAQQIEQVAMLAGRRVGPPPGMGGGPEPHEERAPGIATSIARLPVRSFLASTGQVAPADALGAFAESRRQLRGAHGSIVSNGRCHGRFL